MQRFVVGPSRFLAQARADLAPLLFPRLASHAMTSVLALLERAIPLHRSGDLPSAAKLYQEVLALQPDNANALHLLGLIAQHQGNTHSAIDYFSRAILADPQVASFFLNRGLARRAAGQTAEALEDFQQARRLDAALVEAHHQEGNVLKSLGRYAEAIAPLRTAIRLVPKHAIARLNLGTALLEIRELDEAIRSFREAITLEPQRPEAHNVLGHALTLISRYSEAEASFNEALRLQPNYGAAHDNLGGLLKLQARLPEAIQHYRAALTHAPYPATHSNLLLALNFTDIPPAEILAEHQRWDEIYAAPLRLEPRAVEPAVTSPRRLRVGYVSPDFINHAVARFIEPVLSAHDRNHFEVFCYSSSPNPDAVTTRLRAMNENWRDTSLLNEAQTAALVAKDGVDLLVDLAGHTAGNQLLVFARKPAPVQITWIGYPNTTGVRAMDYRLTDSICDPTGAADALNRETLVRLPGPFSCYLPTSESPAVRELPALKAGYVTFGSFNQFAKLNSRVIELWARVLRVCPSSRLLVRARSLADELTASRLRETFAQWGIEPGRLELDGRQLSVAAHQACYHHVNVALDTFPYNGTTTTCEALWMGVPVVTLRGQTHVARVGASLLTHLGRPEWIAASPEDYVLRCQTLVSDLPALAKTRAGLRDEFRTSPLADAIGFTRTLEATYAQLWAQRRERSSRDRLPPAN